MDIIGAARLTKRTYSRSSFANELPTVRQIFLDLHTVVMMRYLPASVTCILFGALVLIIARHCRAISPCTVTTSWCIIQITPLTLV